MHNGFNGFCLTSNLLLAGINRHAAGKCLDCTLESRVDGVLGTPVACPIMEPFSDDATNDRQMFVRLTSDKELPTGLNIANPAGLLLGHNLQVLKAHDAIIGACNIEKVFDGLLSIARIGWLGDRITTFLVDALNNIVRSVCAVGVIDHDLGSSPTLQPEPVTRAISPSGRDVAMAAIAGWVRRSHTERL